MSAEDIKKIIFLDIDGVLNYDLWYYSDRNPGNLNGQEGEIDPFCVARINHICEVADAHIVISSDWRYDKDCITRLQKAGLRRIIDITPILLWKSIQEDIEYSRGDEIQMWLNDHPQIHHYVIIDDTIDFLSHQLIHFVKVSSYRGLSDEDSMKAIEILINI